MTSRRYIMNCILVAVVGALWATPAVAAEDGVCNPESADAANDPDCANPNQGPHCDYADTCGTAETCGSATTCDTATTCQYADTCGDAATCDSATTCDTATTAAACDTATYADTCGSATTATYAETVGECTTGVFSVGGGASPDCGDLRYDGNLGINTDPTATLDVAGTVALRGAAGQTGLQVDATGNVGINTDAPTAELEVAGTVYANSFTHSGTGTAAERTKMFLPVTNCRLTDGHFTSDGRAQAQVMHCGFSFEEFNYIKNIQCSGWGDAHVEITHRNGQMHPRGRWTTPGTVDLGAGYSLDLNALTEEGSSFSLRIDNANPHFVQLRGCLVTYEVW